MALLVDDALKRNLWAESGRLAQAPLLPAEDIEVAKAYGDIALAFDKTGRGFNDFWEAAKKRQAEKSGDGPRSTLGEAGAFMFRAEAAVLGAAIGFCADVAELLPALAMAGFHLARSSGGGPPTPPPPAVHSGVPPPAPKQTQQLLGGALPGLPPGLAPA